MPNIATADRVDLDGLLEFLRPRHRGLLAMTRSDGRPQLSPVTCGVNSAGQIAVATYPGRAKAVNGKRNPRASICVLSDTWDGPYVQVDGDVTVLDMPEALDGLVDYFRCVSGEHPDWDGYRAAMARQDKSLILLDITRWGPISTGGFPPHLAPS
ncbi:PPOX class F420-dependent oxidoreductase [Actinocorallia longicatena]|uniref:TIGR03618 family F420-dependent PPOX class oxidoreductase n=1 Tax=Actinocorallia longicatena TaxID=111803 RepID=A0ABP6Q0L6_9ACTN